MEGIRGLVGKRVKYLLLVILLLAAGACGISLGMEAWQEWRTPPEQIVGEALMYAVEAPAYSYSSEAVRITDGEEKVISRLTGQKNGENIHLAGTVDVVDSTVGCVSDRGCILPAGYGQWQLDGDDRAECRGHRISHAGDRSAGLYGVSGGSGGDRAG